jgi:hypothetical protein
MLDLILTFLSLAAIIGGLIALLVLFHIRLWKVKPRCADCGGPIGQAHGPPDGWQLEDGRTVCQVCCGRDLHRLAWRARRMVESEDG